LVKEELEEQPRKLEQILIKRSAHDGRQNSEPDNQQRRRKASLAVLRALQSEKAQRVKAAFAARLVK
jgi:hypothetical protein